MTVRVEKKMQIVQINIGAVFFPPVGDTFMTMGTKSCTIITILLPLCYLHMIGCD